jgi:hypothetical protein
MDKVDAGWGTQIQLPDAIVGSLICSGTHQDWALELDDIVDANGGPKCRAEVRRLGSSFVLQRNVDTVSKNLHLLHLLRESGLSLSRSGWCVSPSWTGLLELSSLYRDEEI